MTQEQKIKRLEAQLAMMSIAAKKVLSDIDDDGVAERDDMAVLALRNAVNQCPEQEILSVVSCARRVHSKFGADSDWSEWRDLAEALDALDGALGSSTAYAQSMAPALSRGRAHCARRESATCADMCPLNMPDGAALSGRYFAINLFTPALSSLRPLFRKKYKEDSPGVARAGSGRGG